MAFISLIPPLISVLTASFGFGLKVQVTHVCLGARRMQHAEVNGVGSDNTCFLIYEMNWIFVTALSDVLR